MGSRTRPTERKSVTIKNRSNAKMTVTWQIPDSYDGDDAKDWEVIPAVKEIGPGKSETFKVAFLPTADDFYYSQELEAYATFKVCWFRMLSWALVLLPYVNRCMSVTVHRVTVNVVVVELYGICVCARALS